MWANARRDRSNRSASDGPRATRAPRARARSRPGRRRRARRGSSWRPRAPGSGRRYRSPRRGRQTAMSDRAAAFANGYRLTTTRSIGWMPCAASDARSSGRCAAGENAAVDLGMQRLDAAVHHLGKPGDVAIRDHREAGGRRAPGGPARRDELPTGRHQGLRERHQAGLVGNAQQCAHSTDRHLGPRVPGRWCAIPESGKRIDMGLTRAIMSKVAG